MKKIKIEHVLFFAAGAAIVVYLMNRKKMGTTGAASDTSGFSNAAASAGVSDSLGGCVAVYDRVKRKYVWKCPTGVTAPNFPASDYAGV